VISISITLLTILNVSISVQTRILCLPLAQRRQPGMGFRSFGGMSMGRPSLMRRLGIESIASDRVRCGRSSRRPGPCKPWQPATGRNVDKRAIPDSIYLTVTRGMRGADSS
jgi:hypothetical protein